MFQFFFLMQIDHTYHTFLVILLAIYKLLLAQTNEAQSLKTVLYTKFPVDPHCLFPINGTYLSLVLGGSAL